MATRNPVITQRNNRIKELTKKINELIPEVLKITGFDSDLSLNATYGGKMQDYANVKYTSFKDEDEFIATYLNNFMKEVMNLPKDERTNSNRFKALKMVKDNKIVLNWLNLFLTRTFLRKYEEYTRIKPIDENESMIWIGQEYASYGIAIIPRFNRVQWENDKSEIRRFDKEYFTIGHILKTGLVIPYKNEKINFNELNDYLTFFKSVIVRASKSPHEYEIACRYCEYVCSQRNYQNIPLLIPEFRYNGIDREHKYRLDFCILNYKNGAKVGFELSPWSTHGFIKRTKDKTQKEINDEAQENYHKEIKKYKDYFIKYGITIIAYTDQDFLSYDEIFDDIKKYLTDESAKNTCKNAYETLKAIEL